MKLGDYMVVSAGDLAGHYTCDSLKSAQSLALQEMHEDGYEEKQYIIRVVSVPKLSKVTWKSTNE